MLPEGLTVCLSLSLVCFFFFRVFLLCFLFCFVLLMSNFLENAHGNDKDIKALITSSFLKKASKGKVAIGDENTGSSLCLFSTGVSKNQTGLCWI